LAHPRKNRSDAIVRQIREQEERTQRAREQGAAASVAASRARALTLLDEIAVEIPRVVEHCMKHGPEAHVFTVFVVRKSIFGDKVSRVEKAGWTVASYTIADLGPKYDSGTLQKSWSITADGWLVDPGRGHLTKRKFNAMPDYELPLSGINEVALETVLDRLRTMRSAKGVE